MHMNTLDMDAMSVIMKCGRNHMWLCTDNLNMELDMAVTCVCIKLPFQVIWPNIRRINILESNIHVINVTTKLQVRLNL